MSKRLLHGVGLILVAVAVTSCGPKAGLDVNQTVADANQMASSGNVDQALSQLESFYNSRYYRDSQPDFLKALIQIDLMADRLEPARKRFITAAGKSPAVAAQAAGLIESAMFSKGQFQELMTWCEGLGAYALGDAAFTGTANHHVMALTALGRTGELARVLGLYTPRLSESAAIGLVNGYFFTALKDRQWERAESLLTLLDTTVKDSPEKLTVKIGFSLRLLLAKEGWQAADSYFRKMSGTLPDNEAARNLRVVGDAEVAANAYGAADALYEANLVDDMARPLLREAAAIGWVNVQSKRQSPAELVRRLTVLQGKKIPVEVLVNLISMNYAALIPGGTPETFNALNQFCESLQAVTKGESLLRQMDGILLDISYFRQDYEGSLRIIERGLILEDPEKKALMITKVNAHIALKKGDYRGAIAHFRKFMEIIAKENADTIDPIEQVRVTPDMILGLNARRIGDLWGKAGSSGEAAKAYAEAREHYANALKKFPDPASGEHKKVLREMNEIPQG